MTRDTLIPRPDTELLMEITLARFDQQPIKVVDLGTGSGALAVSLAAERPDWQILGTDISKSALAIARKNAGTLANVNFLVGSWFTNIEGRFDLIISNPPYIRNTDPHLQALKFEPATEHLPRGMTGLIASGKSSKTAMSTWFREGIFCLNTVMINKKRSFNCL